MLPPGVNAVLELIHLDGHPTAFAGEVPNAQTSVLRCRVQGGGLVRAGRSPDGLAEAFEPSAPAIRTGARQADLDEGRSADGLTSAERDELRRLRKENRGLRREGHILGRAAAWCAREGGTIPPKRPDA
jgi:transposase